MWDEEDFATVKELVQKYGSTETLKMVVKSCLENEAIMQRYADTHDDGLVEAHPELFVWDGIKDTPTEGAEGWHDDSETIKSVLDDLFF